MEEAPGAGADFSLRCLKDKKVPIGVTLLVAGLLLTVIALAAKKCPSCLESGIGFGDKCFYFMEQELDWDGSESSCLARGAHMATIDTREELDFLLRYGHSVHHWIGLRREGSGPWAWPNGSLSNGLFRIQGDGRCAYTNSHGISSDWCSQRKFSICSHPQRSPSGPGKDPGIPNST